MKSFIVSCMTVAIYANCLYAQGKIATPSARPLPVERLRLGILRLFRKPEGRCKAYHKRARQPLEYPRLVPHRPVHNRLALQAPERLKPALPIPQCHRPAVPPMFHKLAPVLARPRPALPIIKVYLHN